MNKADLIEALAPRLGGRAQAAGAVEWLVDVILRQVASGGSVTITGFGTFEKVERAPRTGRNPRTGEPVPIAGTTSPRFRPGSYFKEVVADPDSLPSEGIAGARVGSADAEASAGTPTSVRRSASSRRASSGSGSEAAAQGRKRSAASGAPQTVKKTRLRAEVHEGITPDVSSGQDEPARTDEAEAARTDEAEAARTDEAEAARTVEAEKPTDPAADGRVFASGEEITEQILTTKKAQLARVRNDEVVASDNKGKKTKKSKKDKKKGGRKKSKKG